MKVLTFLIGFLLIISVAVGQEALTQDQIRFYKNRADSQAFYHYKGIDEVAKQRNFFKMDIVNLSKLELRLCGKWLDTVTLDKMDLNWPLLSNGLQFSFYPDHSFYINWMHLDSEFPVYFLLGRWKIEANKLLITDLIWSYTTEKEVQSAISVVKLSEKDIRYNPIRDKVKTDINIVKDFESSWFVLYDDMEKVDFSLGYFFKGFNKLPIPSVLKKSIEKLNLVSDNIRYRSGTEETYPYNLYVYYYKMIQDFKAGKKDALERLAWESRFY